MRIDPFSSALEVGAAISRRDVSPVEVAADYLYRIGQLDGGINAFVWLDRDDTLARAERSEQRHRAGEPLGPLDGVPVPIKTLAAVQGQPNDLASWAMPDTPATESDLSVELLEQAGLVLMGRTNSPEFGPLGATENARYGKTRNPWDPAYSPGGSSGGAAAAVTAGLAPVAHGSDGAGSIRIPAAATGLVGLKPSRGRVPARVRGWEHSVTEGALTRTVADAAAMLDILSPPDFDAFYTAPAAERPYSVEITLPPRHLRIGLLLETPVGLPVDDECVQAARGLATTLEALGHTIVEVAPFLYSSQTVLDYNDIVVSAWINAIEMAEPDRADPYIRHRVARGAQITGGQYASLAARLQRESRQVVRQWRTDFDLLLTPTTAIETPRLGVLYDEANTDPDGPREAELSLIAFTAFCNMSGLPAISLPVHTTAGGLPVGAQLVGAPFDEATLLRVAATLEPVYEWHTRRAPAVVDAALR